MEPSQSTSVNYSKIDFAKPPYYRPTYTFPWSALAATVSAVAFAALYEFSYLVGAFAGPVGLAGFAVSVIVGYNLYQSNRGEAEFKFAETFEIEFKQDQAAIHKAIFWLKKAAIRHYRDASIKAEFFQTNVNMENQRQKDQKALDSHAVASYLETFLSQVSPYNISCYLKSYVKEIMDLCLDDCLCKDSFEDIMSYATSNTQQFPNIYKYLWPLVKSDDKKICPVCLPQNL
ncbi:MAG: hypothetical protein ACXWM7_05520 [Parachlamydiaceae bacterium]